ncbi:MAG: class I SAM-dependent methyltransferase [Rhodospirillaceae bacterium]|nr:class I SAM-dependent methyltransferase [Rhodospirillaceae bacterium]
MTPKAEPDNTAVRVALWRALHVLHDPLPHVFTDEIGLAIANPPVDWRMRPDMHPQGTGPFRASILGRARFVEDLLTESEVAQYVILGAGLDTFVQRKPELAARLQVFEVDQPGPQSWKRQRLMDLGFGVPSHLHLVPVNFEAGEDWVQKLVAAGFKANAPAVISSLGVSMYLTREAVAAMLGQVAGLAKGSTFVMSFILPFEYADAPLRPFLERAANGAAASGTPFLSFFTPDEMMALARAAGFKTVQHASAADLGERYFAGRADHLRPPANTEELLIAAI